MCLWYMTRQNFFQEIRNVLGSTYTNNRIERQENPELTFRAALGRNLTTRELEWLGPRRTPNRPRPRTMSPNTLARLKLMYGSPSSPERTRTRNEDVVFLNRLMHPTSNDRIENKVFLLTDMVNSGVKYVYERRSLNTLKKSPFTQKPFEPYHIKSFSDRIPILAKFARLRNNSWSKEFFDTKVLDDFARGKLKRHHDMFFKLFPTKRSLTKHMGLPNTWPLTNMKSLGEFTAKDMDRMRALKRAIDQESDDELKNLYENRLVLLVSNTYGYRRVNFIHMLRRFTDKVPKHMLNVIKV